MHELSIAQSILDIVNQHLPSENKPQVKSIKIRVGMLSNILTDSLIFCFDAITKNSEFENTELIINKVPITIECKSCKMVNEINDYAFLCPNCSSTNIQVIAGNELDIEEIEIE